MESGFLRQVRGELYRMMARKRTHIGFASFVLIEGLLLYFLSKAGVRQFYVSLLERNGFEFERYYSALTIAFIVVGLTAGLLGVLFLALVAGDIVAKEAEDGTLRMVLSRPVTRFRLLLSKYVACVTYTFFLVFFLGVSALAMGLVHRGWGGGMFVFMPDVKLFEVYEFWPGMRRYFLSLVFLSFSLQTASGIAFCFSCFRIKPAAAAILTISLLFIDLILVKMPALADYWYWFLSAKMNDWTLIYQEYIPWPRLMRDYAVLFGVQATCFVIGCLSFQARDLKS